MLQKGQQLDEFEVLELLGQGGMGAVYKARQTSLDRLVALKTLQGPLASNPEYIARFRREAKAAAALNHPNLVQVYAAGETDGVNWFAMEYVEGESAQARLKRKRRLEPAEAVAIAIHIATALEYGWRKAQLIHRDIKPDNIFLSSDGEVKLGDLGLAKSVEENQSLTTTGTSMGTPHYVSPEQAEAKKDVDLRADIYSLGCTLFHLLSGEPPYKADSAMAVMLKHVTAPVPELRGLWPECPDELSRVVMKMMQKEPAERLQNHDEVIADLRAACRAFTNAPVLAQVVGTQPLPVASAAPPAIEKRRSWKKPVAIVVALCVGLAAMFFYWSRMDAEPAKSAAAAVINETPALAISYAGTWTGEGSGIEGFVLNADFTGIRMSGRRKKDENDRPGKWTVDTSGAFAFHDTETQGRWFGQFSADGTTLSHTKSGAILRRVSVPPVATPAPPMPTPAPAVVKFDPAKPASYVGTWTNRGGRKSYIIKEDRTAVRMDDDGQKVNGTWELVNGGFRVKWDDRFVFNGKPSEDGQSMDSLGESGLVWVRKKP